MALNSLSIYLQTNPSAKDTLAEEWGKVIANFEKSTISALFKNTDLSGTPMKGGTVHAKRFANAAIQDYGTARAAASGNKVKALDVPVEINTDKEFVEEVEEKDLMTYGVEGLISRRTAAQDSAMKRYFERKFFNQAVLDGTVHTFSASTIQTKLEEIIQTLETVQNDFVDGIDRGDMCLVLDTATYGLARDYIDTLQNSNISSAVGEFGVFHGVTVFSSVYLPATVNFLIFIKGAVAQPIMQSLLSPEKVPLSDATAFGMFLYYGTTTVTPDLVFVAGTLGSVTATSTAADAGETTKTVITVSSAKKDAANSFWYKSHATAVAAPTYGADASDAGYTELVLTSGVQKITTGTDTKIRVAEVDASGRIIASTAELTIVNGASG